MVRHGGSVTFQGIGDDQIKCCKEWRRCQCEYCCPKRFEPHRRGTIWCEQPAPSSSHQHQHQQQQQQQPPPPPPPPRSQDAQVRGDQRMESEIDAQTICYEEPFLFRRLESLIRRNQDGIVIKQNEDGFLIKKAEEGKKKKKTSRRASAHPETDSDSSAPQTGEAPFESKPPEEQPEGEEKKRKKEKKKKKKKRQRRLRKEEEDRAKHGLQCDLPIRYKPHLPSPRCIMVIKSNPSRHLHFLLLRRLPLSHLPATSSSSKFCFISQHI